MIEHPSTATSVWHFIIRSLIALTGSVTMTFQIRSCLGLNPTNLRCSRYQGEKFSHWLKNNKKTLEISCWIYINKELPLNSELFWRQYWRLQCDILVYSQQDWLSILNWAVSLERANLIVYSTLITKGQARSDLFIDTTWFHVPRLLENYAKRLCNLLPSEDQRRVGYIAEVLDELKAQKPMSQLGYAILA